MPVPNTSPQLAYVALERLAQRAADLDAGRIPNQLAAFALAVRRAAIGGPWEPISFAESMLAELVEDHEAVAPTAPLTALLREALAVVRAVADAPPPTQPRRPASGAPWRAASREP